MAVLKVNWGELAGLQLRTATGAPFKVVRVSATHVAVRPQRGTRDYALSISQELEPAAAVCAAGNLPSPSELRHLGVRAVYTSYAWGILKAIVQDRIGVRTVKRAKLKDFAGTWLITAMDDMAEDYWADEPEAPFIRLEVPRGSSGLAGEYVIGLSSGGIDGDLREFGGEPVVIFGYDGVDEMDPSSGGGWLQLLDASRDTLEGEFMGPLGRFRAERKASSKKTVRQPSRRRGLAIRLR
jgi:hypothetical protein